MQRLARPVHTPGRFYWAPTTSCLVADLTQHCFSCLSLWLQKWIQWRYGEGGGAATCGWSSYTAPGWVDGKEGERAEQLQPLPSKKPNKTQQRNKKNPSKTHITHQTAKEPSTVSAGSPTHRSITTTVWREMTASRTKVQKAQYDTFVTQKN